MEGNCLTNDATIGFQELRVKQLNLGFSSLLHRAEDVVALSGLPMEREREGGDRGPTTMTP